VCRTTSREAWEDANIAPKCERLMCLYPVHVSIFHTIHISTFSITPPQIRPHPSICSTPPPSSSSPPCSPASASCPHEPVPTRSPSLAPSLPNQITPHAIHTGFALCACACCAPPLPAMLASSDSCIGCVDAVESDDSLATLSVMPGCERQRVSTDNNEPSELQQVEATYCP
jgi:hypothetical protein